MRVFNESAAAKTEHEETERPSHRVYNLRLSAVKEKRRILHSVKKKLLDYNILEGNKTLLFSLGSFLIV